VNGPLVAATTVRLRRITQESHLHCVLPNV
jgi:hypothetical protein